MRDLARWLLLLQCLMVYRRFIQKRLHIVSYKWTCLCGVLQAQMVTYFQFMSSSSIVRTPNSHFPWIERDGVDGVRCNRVVRSPARASLGKCNNFSVSHTGNEVGIYRLWNLFLDLLHHLQPNFVGSYQLVRSNFRTSSWKEYVFNTELCFNLMISFE